MDAYADRSWYSGARLYAIGLFLARANAWAALQLKWRRILDRADVDVFHMTDFVAGKRKPYKGWDQHERARFLRSLLRTIAEHADYGCASVLTPEGYQALLQHHAERSAAGRPSMGDNPYEVCADACIGVVNLKLMKTGWTDRRVAYVFEHGDPGQGIWSESITTILRRSRKYREENRILTAVTARKRDAPALQTADILAYEFSHCRADRGEYTDNINYLAAIPLDHFYIGAAFINRLVAEYTDTMPSQLIEEYGLSRIRQRRQGRP